MSDGEDDEENDEHFHETEFPGFPEVVDGLAPIGQTVAENRVVDLTLLLVLEDLVDGDELSELEFRILEHCPERVQTQGISQLLPMKASAGSLLDEGT